MAKSSKIFLAYIFFFILLWFFLNLILVLSTLFLDYFSSLLTTFLPLLFSVPVCLRVQFCVYHFLSKKPSVVHCSENKVHILYWFFLIAFWISFFLEDYKVVGGLTILIYPCILGASAVQYYMCARATRVFLNWYYHVSKERSL